ncbi:N-alpha-acetyltransferase 38, NatC auxiliary subunit-like [Sycon ciliatum]|uniref:N-alpha-acetyltransferase 38, NatC auxiliary subunit-like n=1 Tax=Sycon ciliatum TaxID=27933 RepID=UPI0031F70FA2
MDGPLTLLGRASTLHEAAEDCSTRKPSAAEKSPFLAKFLQKPLRIVIKDGRVLTGRLLCTDRDCNIILSDCEQILPMPDGTPASPSPPSSAAINTGMVMVPGCEIVTMSKEATPGRWKNTDLHDGIDEGFSSLSMRSA